MVNETIRNLKAYQSECVSAFKMECSPCDIKTNPEAKKLAKYINRQGKIIDVITYILSKIF